MQSLHPASQATKHAAAACSSTTTVHRPVVLAAPSCGWRRQEHAHVSCPHQRPVVLVAAAPGSISWSEDEQKLLWAATSRALLKLGKGGVQESHCSNLKSLLSAHSLVRVQLNADPAGANQLAGDLARGSSAHLLGVNGRNILFGNGTLDKQQLLAVAQKSSGRIQAYNQKKKEASEAAADAASVPVQGSSNSTSGTGPAAKPAAKGFGGNQGRGGVDHIIAKNLSSGPLTRSTLKEEWESVSSSLFEEGVAQAEAEMRGLRTGSRTGTPGAFGRGTPGAFGRGGRGGRGGAGGRGGQAGGRSGRGGRSGGAGRGQR